MGVLWIAWAGSAGAMLLLYLWAGWTTPRHLGVLVDTRGRYSLSRFQLGLWTLVILPLIAGVVVARAFVRGTDPFEFTIPSQVISLLGLSVATTAVATGVKTYKDRTRTEFIAAGDPKQADLRQIVLVEEGPDTGTVDFTKLQQLALAVLLGGGYVVTCIHTFLGAGKQVITTPDQITALPALDTTFVTLLGLSQLGYVAGKLPKRGGALIDPDDPGDADHADGSAPRALATPEYSLRDKLRGEPPPPNPKAQDRWASLRADDRRRKAAAHRSTSPTGVVTGSGSPVLGHDDPTPVNDDHVPSSDKDENRTGSRP